MMLGKEEIENRFGFHKGTDETIPRHAELRQSFISFVSFIDETIPDSREKSLALTALQEAAMWSNCAIAMEAPLVRE